MTSVAHREKTAIRYVEAVNTRDVDAMQAIFARDARLEDPVGSEPIVGIGAIVAFYRDIIFPQVRSAELTGPARCPENAVAFSFRVVSDGENGEQSTDIIDVLEFDDDGLVIQMKAYWTPF